MAETTADVRRDIELTRERMSSTIDELERKLNVAQMVRDHPWPALALAMGAGVLLSGSRADVRAAAATVSATKGASARLGSALDVVVADIVTALEGAFHGQVDRLLSEIKDAIGAPRSSVTRGSHGGSARSTTAPGYGVGPVDITPDRVSPGAGDIPRAD